jgi:hypothetical protein
MKVTLNLKNVLAYLPILFLALVFTSCNPDNEAEEVVEENEVSTETDLNFVTTDWTDATHSKDADPNFTEVFSNSEVKRLDIVITKANWQTMLDDMTKLYGAFGTRSTGGFSSENPIFVPAEVFYKGKEWYRVGVRFKGNSSLASTWGSGNLKLSFKLDFDELEDTYPQIKNQRFYGFKKLSLKNNYDDKSMLREKVAAEIFNSAGIPVSHTSIYAVYVDHGSGPVYFGVYTLVEEVDDTVLDDQFGDNSGNLYKPDGNGASFANSTFRESVFVKENNEDEADWTDIKNLFAALHSTKRTSDAAAWRSDLEAIFDTDMFLKYLAVNTVIQNWDTYGRMTHNYFLYNNPDTKKLTWIPWDNNEALQAGKQQGALPLNFAGLNSSQWPLIGYLYRDPTYKAKYNSYVSEIVKNGFDANSISATYTKYAALVEPYATIEISGHTFLRNSSEFQLAISELKSHATQRSTAVKTYLGN